MKTARILWIGVVVLLIGTPSAGAQGRPMGRLNPPGREDRKQVRRTVGHVRAQSRTSQDTHPAASLLEGFNAGTKKFFVDTGTGVKTFFARTNAGTKRFLAGTRNALTWKSPAAKKKKRSKRPKRSWLDSLLGPEEPKPIRSLDDWWELKRMDP